MRVVAGRSFASHVRQMEMSGRRVNCARAKQAQYRVTSTWPIHSLWAVAFLPSRLPHRGCSHIRDVSKMPVLSVTGVDVSYLVISLLPKTLCNCWAQSKIGLVFSFRTTLGGLAAPTADSTKQSNCPTHTKAHPKQAHTIHESVTDSDEANGYRIKIQSVAGPCSAAV
jgi:hypothetical protein